MSQPAEIEIEEPSAYDLGDNATPTDHAPEPVEPQPEPPEAPETPETPEETPDAPEPVPDALHD